MMLPTVVRADIMMLRPEAVSTKTYYLDQGDVITWDWKLIGEGNVDFWIEDGEGTRYRFVDNATKGSGSFVAPSSGEWSVKFYNDSPDPAGATISYTITIGPPLNGFVWTAAIIGIILIMVAVVFVLLILRKKRK